MQTAKSWWLLEQGVGTEEFSALFLPLLRVLNLP